MLSTDTFVAHLILIMNIIEKINTKKGPLGEHTHYAHGYYTFPKLDGEIGARITTKNIENLVWSFSNYLGDSNGHS